MADEAVGDDRVAGAEALPRTHVLGYLTNAAAMATRVRRVTSVAMLWIAIAFLLAALLAVWGFATTEGYYLWRAYSGGALTAEYVIACLLWYDALYGLGWHFILMMAGPPAVILLCCTGAVMRGRTGVCQLCSVLMLPLVLAGGWTAATFAAWALYMGTGLYRPPTSRLYLLGFVGVAALAVVTLLLWDVRNYLRWIARNPMAEKPAVAFLPKKG